MKNHTLFLLWFLSIGATSVVGQNPVITSFSPESGAVGTTVNISGSGFGFTPADNIVYFGATRAGVVSVSATSLTVVVPAGATYKPITVTANGLSAYSTKPFALTFTSTGTFSNRSDFWAGSQAKWGTVGDIDGDGKTDILSVDEAGNALYVWRNVSTPGFLAWYSFEPMLSFSAGPNPYALALGDLDGDGKLDVVVTNGGGNAISVFHNISSPGYISFDPAVDVEVVPGPVFVSIRDIDGDGKSDIAVASTNNFAVGMVSILRNISTAGSITAGSFAPRIDFEAGNGGVWCVMLEDIDGDTKTDMLVTSGGDARLSIFRNISTPGDLTTGSFSARVDFPTGNYPALIAISDLDGDSKPDVVVGNAGGDSMSFFRNTSASGDINGTSFVREDIFSPDPWNPTAGDVDGDGKIDIVVRDDSGNLLLYKNSSTAGSFSFSPSTLGVGGAPLGISVADLDGDGLADLVVSNEAYNLNTIFQNINISPPVALDADFISNTGFEAHWLGVENTTEYRLDVSPVADFSFFADGYQDRQIFLSDSIIIHFTVAGLLPDTDYFYRIRAVSNYLSSPNSATISVRTVSHPPMASPNIWVSQFGDWGEEEIQTMVSDDKGNIFIAGHFNGALTFGTTTLYSQGDFDIFFARLNAHGNVVWARSIGGPFYDNEVSIAVDKQGLYMTAQFSGDIDVDPGTASQIFSNEGQLYINDSFFARYNPATGALVWARKLVDAASFSSSSIGVDKSGVYLTGHYNGSIDFNPGAGIAILNSQGQEDIFLAKYTLQGNYSWAGSMGGPGYETSWGLMLDGTGVYIHGYYGDVSDFNPRSGVFNLQGSGGFFGRYDLTTGNFKYAKRVGNGSILSICKFENSLLIAGDIHGTTDADPGLGTRIVGTDGFTSGLVGKYNLQDGKLRWAKSFPTTGYIGPRKVLADVSGVYVSGYFGGSVDFDPDNGEANRSSGQGDAFAAHYSLHDGHLFWAKAIGGNPGYATSIAATLTQTGYFLGGLFGNTVNFDPYTGSVFRTSNGGSDIFIAKYQRSCFEISTPTITANAERTVLESSASTGNQWFKNDEPLVGATEQTLRVNSTGRYSVQVTLQGCSCPKSTAYSVSKNLEETTLTAEEVSSTDLARLYPNPANEVLSVDWKGFGDGPIDVTITDVLGKVMIVKTMTGGEQSVDVGRLKGGVHIFRARQGNKVYVQRFIKK